MNGRERFLSALGGGQPDRVPIYDVLAQKDIYEVTIGRRPDTYNARDVVEAHLALGIDAAYFTFSGFRGLRREWIEEGVTYRGEWGETYKIDPAAWPSDAPIEFPVTSKEDLKTYKLPDPTLPGRCDDIDLALKLASGQIAILGGVRGPFSQAWMMTGPERLMTSFYDDPGFVKNLFKLSNEYHIEAARIQAKAGVDAMLIADDMGYKTAGFISLEHYRRYLLPFVQDLVASIRKTGMLVVFHSDGCIGMYLDDMVDAGISAIHPLQRTAGMDLKAVKEKYGKRVCVFGNVDSSRTLPYGSVQDVESEVRECIRTAAPGGGYVLSSDHSLHDGIPVENIKAMMKAAKKWGAYPIRLDDS